jgi:hypothetical protein
VAHQFPGYAGASDPNYQGPWLSIIADVTAQGSTPPQVQFFNGDQEIVPAPGTYTISPIHGVLLGGQQLYGVWASVYHSALHDGDQFTVKITDANGSTSSASEPCAYRSFDNAIICL